MLCLFHKPSATGAIPGLPVDLDARHRKTVNKPMLTGEQLEREVEKKAARKGSDKQHVARKSSADRAEESRDFTFTEDDSPFHLWYPVKVRLHGRDYESAGHYLTMKSLGKCFYDVTLNCTDIQYLDEFLLLLLLLLAPPRR